MPKSVSHLTALSEKRTGRNLTAWSMLAGLVLFGVLAGPYFAGRVYTADDLGAFHLPVRAFYAAQIARGEPFDWMPSLYSGFYLTGEGQVGAYHPLHQALYRWFSLRAAWGLECLLSYPLMMLGTWMFLRRRIGGGGAAALGALLFAFSSFNLLHFVHPNAIAVVAHIPWLLWAIDVVLLDGRRRRVALASVLIALLTGSQLLLGYPQFVWLSWLAEASYAAFLLTAYRYAPRTGCDAHATCNACVGCATHTWPRLIIAKGIGLLLGGVQLLPTLDAWLHSDRLSADGVFTSWGSLHPMNLVQLVAPYMFAGRVVGGNTHEFGTYIGVVPLVLLVWMIVRRNELGSLSRTAWAALGFSVAALLLAFGRYGPLYYAMSWLPIVGTFRCPCRYLALFQFAAAVMAAIGFALLTRECLLARKNRSLQLPGQRRRPWRGLWRDFEPLWCVVGLSAAVAAAGFGLRHQPRFAGPAAILAGPLLFAAAAALVVLAARGRKAALAGLIVFAAADLGFYGMSYAIYPYNHTLDRYADSVRTPPGKTGGRVVADLMRLDEPGIRTSDAMTLRGWPRADGYAGLAPARRLDYRLLPALRVAGVQWVKNGPSTTVVAGLKPFDRCWLSVPDPLPRVRLVSKTRTSVDPAADITAINPAETALVETPLVLPASEPGEAVLTAQRPGRIEVAVDCPAPQLLVLAESHHPGWRATIDGKPCPLLRVNGDFIGCPVMPGKHSIVFEFRPESLHRGWIASLMGLCLASLCFLGFTAPPGSSPPENFIVVGK